MAILCSIFQRLTAGRVAFDFSVDLGQLSRPGMVQASPSSGTVGAGERAHIKLKVGWPAALNPCFRDD
jgi:hypothetical protein